MNTNWKIHYFNNRLWEEINSLPDTLLARYLRLADLMIKKGPNLGEPHTKTLGQGLFELRLKGKEGIARVFYCTLIENKIYMLHSFIKKTQKIPIRELEIAKKRMTEVKHGN